MMMTALISASQNMGLASAVDDMATQQPALRRPIEADNCAAASFAETEVQADDWSTAEASSNLGGGQQWQTGPTFTPWGQSLAQTAAEAAEDQRHQLEASEGQLMLAQVSKVAEVVETRPLWELKFESPDKIFA